LFLALQIEYLFYNRLRHRHRRSRRRPNRHQQQLSIELQLRRLVQSMCLLLQRFDMMVLQYI
jgi:hypothetical protein